MSPNLQFIGSIPWFAWIPIVAIVCSCVTSLSKMHYLHLERMEKIRQGIDPDATGSSGKPYAELEL